MAAVSALVSYLIKFIFLIAVAVGGIFYGKKLSDKKKANNSDME